MNRFLRGVVQATAETFALPGPVLEVGSYQVPGQEAIADLRDLFPGRPYVGLDVRGGRGVDMVGDVEALPQADRSVGTVLALSTFEHVAHFWKGFQEVHRVLRPDGAFVVACPCYFHLHAHPADYWRFTPDALRVLLEPYPSVVLGWHGPASRPANVWAVAFREEHPGVPTAQYRAYQEALRRHACMPLPWARRLRFLLGGLVFGRGLFAPYLDRERWQTQLIERSPWGVGRRRGQAREAEGVGAARKG